ncbi:bifunctional diguanylate cyclase/phosphodiesterase [Desulfohalobiaceae bacterium Ax17]|uniref:EAL domain-containing protein n=1 Tax=Desulfovulcanus ferrireducens TaxID=2831190 RepID=UPI00207BA34B|nr:bifunctional diguanylate cyclase/phosphodiesterase [Desulfovulcanus ferrireducens]MBT8763886.1 bifunctional diguanylate cyclase/phosphodiesterase [Desulfovulcanus ferrireducens]
MNVIEALNIIRDFTPISSFSPTVTHELILKEPFESLFQKLNIDSLAFTFKTKNQIEMLFVLPRNEIDGKSDNLEMKKNIMLEHIKFIGFDIYEENKKLTEEIINLEINKNNKNKTGIITIPYALPNMETEFFLSVFVDDSGVDEVSLVILSNIGLQLGFMFLVRSTGKKLAAVSERDTLTGFYTRETLFKLIEFEIKKAKTADQPMSIALLNIDNIQLINAKYGVIVGDNVIKAVGNMIKSYLRETDIVGRFAGDEFLILSPFTSVEEAYDFFEQFRKRVEKANILNDKKIRITVSMGLIEVPKTIDSLGDVESALRVAVKKAKGRGKNNVQVLKSKDEIKKFHKKIVSGFEFIKSKILNKEVYPFFQPIHNLKSGNILGYEALARVKVDNEYKSIYAYFEILDELGLWGELDKIIIDKVFRLKKETSLFNGKRIFINLSGRFLLFDENRKWFLNIEEEYHINPKQVVLEITEREYINDIFTIATFLNQLKEKGYNIAIDDFGSGYSSYEYIKLLNPHIIKIDGSLVKDCVNQRIDLKIISNITSLCKELGISVVAEWIENKAILDKLKEVDIDYGQGFYLSRPQNLFGD